MAKPGSENAVKSFTKVKTELALLTLEDLIIQHRRERKELQAKIQSLKKNAPKSDKKKRKETMEEITQLEKELEQRQQAELATAKSKNNINYNKIALHSVGNDSNDKNHAAAVDSDADISQTNCHNNLDTMAPAIDDDEEKQHKNTRITKAQKRREKKAREARIRAEEIETALKLINLQQEPKITELQCITAKLTTLKLNLHQISSDGNCLYNAIRHQLLEHGLPAYTIDELRAETAEYIASHKSQLINYMTNADTGDLLSDQEFINYCDAIRNTAAWGGYVELKALSSVLKIPIEVIQADGPPIVLGADEFNGPSLIITYHRYMYQLGEHYNSTKPISAVTPVAS